MNPKLNISIIKRPVRKQLLLASFYLLSLFAVLFVANPTQAATIVWTNTASGNWSGAANWSPNQVPSSTDNVFINGGITVTLTASATAASLTLAGTLNVNTPGNMAVANLTLNGGGTLGGTGPVAVNGPFTWSSGILSSSGGVTLNGTSSLNGASVTTMQLYGVLLNAGQLTWSGSAANLYMGGTLTNLPTGTITIAADVSAATTGSGLIVNAGLLRKSGTAGTSTLATIFINNGDLQVQSGTVALTASGSGTGTVELSANATLQFAGSGYAFNSPASLTGAGTLLVSGGSVSWGGTISLAGTNLISSGTLNVNTPGNMAVANLTLNGGGTLGGTGPVAVNGPFTWSSGILSSSSGMTLNGASSLNGAGVNSMQLYGLLLNAGQLTWGGSAANLYMSGTLTNLPSGTMTIAADVSAGTSGGGVIVNAGLLRKTGTTGISTLATVFINKGMLDTQSGTVSLTGSYSLNSGTLNFGISGATNFGKINLAGAASLTGTLSANLIGGYLPNSTNAFAVLGYGSKSGTFTSTNLPAAVTWQVNYGSTVTTLQVLNARPQLTGATNQTVNELTLLTMTNIATDVDTPAQTLTLGLVSAPSGMTINAGAINWTPAQTQSPSTNLVVVSVTDNGTPPLSATNSFTVMVTEVNVAPTLPTISTQSVNGLTLFTVANTATNANIHSSITGYRLVAPPSNMVINASGVITWTSTLAQSPSTNLVTTIVTNSNPFDLVNPQLTATNSFTVIVKEVNVAPTLPVITTKLIYALTPLTVINTATGTSAHATVTYGLVNPPVGMAISSGGVITWTPATEQSPSTNLITTIATSTDLLDTINPNLSTTNAFVVVVKPVVKLTAPTMLANGAFEFSFNTVANSSYTIEQSTNLMVWSAVLGFIGNGSPVTVYDPNAGIKPNGFYRVLSSP